jgi:Protein of unknown function (DUF4238)
VSGRKQHHIPQMVLRGFATPGNGKNEQVWVFTKAKTYPSSTKGVGAERHFYSELSSNGTQTLDDLITGYEKRLGSLLATLRAASPGQQVDATVAAEVVAHLSIRNAHIRKSFGAGMQLLVDEASNLFTNEDNLRAMLGVTGRQFPEKIAAMVREEMTKDTRFAQTGLPRPVLEKIAFMTMKENFSRAMSDTVPLMQAALQLMAKDAPKMSRQGHNEALSKGVSADKRAEQLSGLTWSVQEYSPELILPDCVALGIESDNQPLPLILADPRQLTSALMPLAPDRMLVGLSRGSDMPDLARFNGTAAACSHSFFISHRKGDDLTELVSAIGTRSDETIQAAIGAAFEEFKTDRQLILPSECPVSDGATAEPSPTEETSPQKLDYPVSFHGIADRETAERIAGLLNHLVYELRSYMALDRLDGFTFAEDYDGALEKLDRGFTSATPLKASTPECGESVAMTPKVMRDGILKGHVVARLWIALALISEDEISQRLALHLIVQQLAHVACTQLFDEALPGARLDDPYDAFLYPYIAEAWSGYIGARTSAVFDPSFGASYRELAMSALSAARENIPQARLEYRYHGDMDRLLSAVLPRIEAVLQTTAQLLGHYDGLGEATYFGELLAKNYEEAGLRLWIELFQSDLELVWNRRGQWASLDEFLSLNQHVERLLWQFGLFPSKADDGQIHVDVPSATDAAQLRLASPVRKRWWARVVERIRAAVKRRTRAN